MENLNKIDYLFEVSWEVCNKVGGIHTVVATKALTLEKKLKDNLILIGPNLDRDGQKNIEFEEDANLFKVWRNVLHEEGLNVKIGRWKIPGKPLVFLIDFSFLFSKKDDIFTEMWNSFQLDSISGSWDYVEAAMFGYAAGMLITSFYEFHLSFRQRVVAQFHEWMTGTGLLYLKKNCPKVSTIFTTHATTVGRSIAGNNQPLYRILNEVNGDNKARELNVFAKHSLEKTATREADVFTTVSELTAKEAVQLLERKVDVILPNGFDASIVPEDSEYQTVRQTAFNTLKNVSEKLFGYKLTDEVHFICTSGRYEYKNKGIDLYLDSLAQLREKEGLNKEVVAFIMVPANNYGPRKDLMEKIAGKEIDIHNKFLTHNLHDAEFDTVLKRIYQLGFTNEQNQKVKIIFVPAYLNGNDGIFNISYYRLLPGFSLTVFPSYYEPWGYTPLESLAFHVPTITTTLAGFGLWIKSQNVDLGDCMSVISRNEDNYQEVVNNIVGAFINCSYKTPAEIELNRTNAFFVSKTAQWKNLITFYYKAYNLAIEKSEERTKDLVIEQVKKSAAEFTKKKIVAPNWRNASVLPNLPKRIKGLDEISKNLWWEWNTEAVEMFKMIDENLWAQSNRNPLKMLKEIPYEKLLKLEKDSIFLTKYEIVYTNFKEYIKKDYDKALPDVSYFSMEYGLVNFLKIYSGGLGILAGDYLKQASDRGIKMVAVGLFYKLGYFTQQLSIRGEQIENFDILIPSDLPVELVKDSEGKAILIQVGLPGRNVQAQIWQVNVGRIPLYLLDTDIEQNRYEDRSITHQLYGGDNEHRLKQEMILGIGGIRALRKLNIRTDVYHSNEGHAAFTTIERINQHMNENRLTFAEAVEIVRASTLFTTHTPVPAGHDAFSDDFMMSYFGHYPDRLRITWEEFLKLGKLDVYDKTEEFSMSYLASNLSQEINGVSYLHGEVTKKMFAKLWNGYYPEESHIGYVTNGVHYQTWAADKWKKLVDKYFSENSTQITHDPKIWSKIYEVPDKEIWNLRNELRYDLVSFLKARINTHYVKQRKSPQQVVAIQNKVKENILTLGFARRFAPYKRAHLMFYNTERLAKILNDPDRPVQIIFAGKAHPKDGPGKELIERIVEISKLPAFLGKIIFLENYDMETAKRLVQGVDVWINTPTRPLEASGTSGMKATMNGVLNLSVLDGWWVEGYKEGAGWALPLERTYENQEFQNQLDSEMIYEILENEVVPMFYNRDEYDVPKQWIQFIKKNIAQIAPEFTTNRMLEDYIDRFYIKMAQRKAILRKNDYKIAQEISAWKKRMTYSWESIIPQKITFNDELSGQLNVGETYPIEVEIDLNEVAVENVGIEFLVIQESNENVKILDKKELELKKVAEKIAVYSIDFKPTKPGLFKYGFRMFAKHPLLPHRLDFPLYVWL